MFYGVGIVLCSDFNGSWDPSFIKYVKKIFCDCINIKINIIQARFIIITFIVSCYIKIN